MGDNPMRQLSADFLEECDTLAGLIETFEPADYEKPTQFKGWTVNDVLVHLHFWNRAADMALTDPDGFQGMFAELVQAIQTGGLRPFENAEVSERGPALFELWRDFYRDMGARWADLDPKHRVKWAGPDMSVRSSLTARQMENWAHGQEVFDLAGKKRAEGDRIRNIVILGVNTYKWGFSVRGMKAPEPMPKLVLTSPSGEVWEYGEGPDLIEGSAVGFCQVVTQTRNVYDTDLTMTGDSAVLWMENAQCFAGPPETPPAKGTRG